MMNIIPALSPLNQIQEINGLGPVGGGPSIVPGTEEAAAKNFGDVFREAIENVEHLNQISQADAYALSIGEVDNIAQMQINSQKLETSVQLMVQMRNKLLDSYSEIMRMNI